MGVYRGRHSLDIVRLQAHYMALYHGRYMGRRRHLAPPGGYRPPRRCVFRIRKLQLEIIENHSHREYSSGTTTSSPCFSSLLPTIFAAAAVGVASVDASFADVGELAVAERQRLEELIKSRGMQPGSYPLFTVDVRGPKVALKFKVPPSCDVSRLIVDIVSLLGQKAERQGGGSEMLLHAWDSAAAWQFTLTSPEKMIGTDGRELYSEMNKSKDDFCVLIFEPLLGSEYCEIEFIKEGSFTFKELDAFVTVLKLAGLRDAKNSVRKNPGLYNFKSDSNYHGRSTPSLEKSISALEAMGVRVYGVDENFGVPMDNMVSWDNIAGYDQQKREIEDTILLALKRPEIYDEIARGTRSKFESNRPRAVLFEGPPGTGKTSCARVIAKEAGVPMLYVPLEVVMSKYYGESERLFGNVFSLANDLPDGAIIFLDEVDSFAATRDSEMHEATRRILSVLLRQIDGFEQEKRVLVIAATNRKQDLDPALISRFDSIIDFCLPDHQTRAEIAAQYAKHLKESELVRFASVTEDMSGRDIKDVCLQAERRWASKLIRGQVDKDAAEASLPPLEEYIKSAKQRQEAVLTAQDRSKSSAFMWKPRALA
ncbi:ATPase family gene 2 protein [Phalaenopsis equestris]|uniref:ATPase family gene 2 protein n=1 Tax=Phalaenopsis equestris TaxID=78828 RepID=UPI0009E44691|nr:ATPase family gene 2 protein [Phalaenopsis equestris]